MKSCWLLKYAQFNQHFKSFINVSIFDVWIIVLLLLKIVKRNNQSFKRFHTTVYTQKYKRQQTKIGISSNKVCFVSAITLGRWEKKECRKELFRKVSRTLYEIFLCIVQKEFDKKTFVDGMINFVLIQVDDTFYR